MHAARRVPFKGLGESNLTNVGIGRGQPGINHHHAIGATGKLPRDDQDDSARYDLEGQPMKPELTRFKARALD